MTDTDTDAIPGELVPTGGPMAELHAYIAGLEPEDEADVQDRILRSILTATTPEQLAGAGGAVPCGELCGILLRAHAIHPAESTFVDGSGWYLHVEVETVANGDRLTMSVGAQDVVVKLVQAARNGWLPFAFRMERSTKATKAGFYPIYMRPAEEPF
jgi:hypothetical protein